MKNLIHEVHRRSLWQVLGIYLAGSWIALQVVETLSESMSLPDWVQGFSVILLVLGLPMVLATAFVQEGVGRKASAPEAATAGDDTVAPEEPAEAPALPAGEPGPAPRSRAPALSHGLFTWRRAIAGGVVAFALLGVSLVGWVVMRSLGVGPAGTLVAKGILEDQATLLLTDFQSDDESLSRAATEAIRVDLAQSNVVDVADPGVVLAALERMERSSDQRLDVATGRDLALREGMPALVAGEITSAGSGYVLTARILTAEDGAVLVSDRVTADDDSELIGAIDQLSKKLRERIGESLGDLAATPALESVTTADLEALRLYSRAVALSDAGEQQQAADLLEESVALDPGFAMAWRKLGAIYTSGGGAMGQLSRGVEAYAKAYESRDRLTKRERLLTVAGYYRDVEQDPRRSADAYEEMLRTDPDDTWALNNLGIIMGADLGDDERAQELLRRTIELEPETANGYWNLSVSEGRTGDYAAAGRTLDQWKANLPRDAVAYLFDAGRAGSIREFDEADSLARYAATLRPGNELDQSFAMGTLAVTALTRGRIEDGYRLNAQAEEASAELGAGQGLGTALGFAEVELDTRADRAAAAERLENALARYPLSEMGPLDPPWDQIVRLEARLRGVERARQTLANWEAADSMAAALPAYDVSRAWVQIAEGDAAGALRSLEGVVDPDCLDCAPFARLVAAREGGDVASILEYGEAYVDRPGLFRIFSDASTLGPTIEDLAQRYDEGGELQDAARHYAAFVELWATADEELQPRVRAAQARLEEILREIG